MRFAHVCKELWGTYFRGASHLLYALRLASVK